LGKLKVGDKVRVAAIVEPCLDDKYLGHEGIVDRLIVNGVYVKGLSIQPVYMTSGQLELVSDDSQDEPILKFSLTIQGKQFSLTHKEISDIKNVLQGVA
jgi:hypothetical protein